MKRPLRFFDWLRGYRSQDEVERGQYIYEANVSVQHPNVAGSLHVQPVRIDANSADHARRQLHDTCRITVKMAVKAGESEVAGMKFSYRVTIVFEIRNANDGHAHRSLFQVEIDANTAYDACRQLQDKCTIAVGRARKIGHRRITTTPYA